MFMKNVPRSPTIEGCQSSFAESGAHISEMEKIWSLRIARASHFADTGIKDVALRSNNSNYGVTLLPDEQRRKSTHMSAQVPGNAAA
jgi:hypothetical protein